MPLTPILRQLSYSLSSSLRTSTSTSRSPFTTGPPMGSWSGRKVEDHVVNRTDAKDVQAESSQAALKEKEQGKSSHSHGVAQTSGGQNKKAKEEHPSAPEPIIGMNDERGQKGHKH